jgi:hypothetical protein
MATKGRKVGEVARIRRWCAATAGLLLPVLAAVTDWSFFSQWLGWIEVGGLVVVTAQGYPQERWITYGSTTMAFPGRLSTFLAKP